MENQTDKPEEAKKPESGDFYEGKGRTSEETKISPEAIAPERQKRKYTKRRTEYKSWGGRRASCGRKSTKYDPKGIGQKKPKSPEIARSLYGMSTEKEAKDALQSMAATQSYLKSDYVIRCPDDLRDDKDAIDQWNSLMSAYSAYDRKIICQLDTNELRLFCESKSRYSKAYKTWQEILKGEIVDKSPTVNSWIDKCLRIMQKESDIMRGLSQDLLLSPNGRVKANIKADVGGKTKADTALDAFKSWQNS